MDSSARTDGDRAGAGQERDELRTAGLLGGDLGQPVLDDPVLDVLRAQLSAHLEQISHGQAPVVGDDRGVRLLEELDELRHGCLLGFCGHVTSFRSGAAGATTPVCPAQERRSLRHAAPGPERVRFDTCLGVPVGVPAPLAVRSTISVRSDEPGGGLAARQPAWLPRTHRCLWRNDLRFDGKRPVNAVMRALAARCRQAAARASRPGTSTRMPGPMVEATVRLLKYWPLISLGRARLIASVRAARLSTSWCLLEAGLAEGHVDDAALVDLELDAATLELVDHTLEVEGHGAGLGVGHQAACGRGCGRACPRDPSCRAWPRPRRTRASRPRSSRPGRRRRRRRRRRAVASAALSPWAKTATRTTLPLPCGRETVPRTICSA